MELNWQPEIGDLEDALTARTTSDRAGRTAAVALLSLIGIGGLTYFLLPPIYSYALFWLSIITFVAWLRFFNPPGTTQTPAEQLWEKHERLRRPAGACFEHDGVRVINGEAGQVYPWSAVRWVIETERSVILLVRPPVPMRGSLKLLTTFGVSHRIPLPKRAFANPGQVSELRSRLIEATDGRYSYSAPRAGDTPFPRGRPE